MAPLFSKKSKKLEVISPVPPKIFQKPLEEMADNLESLRSAGDFFYDDNYELLANLFVNLSRSRSYSDLAGICANWYKKPPKKIQKIIKVGDEKGRVKTITLPKIRIEGAW